MLLRDKEKQLTLSKLNNTCKKERKVFNKDKEFVI
jgi:hypothetical protein